jgi:RNA polymerase primary sigma factor
MPLEDSDSLGAYMRQIAQFDLLTPQQEIELAARIKKGDKAARTQMINSNLRLVVKIAHDYAGYGLPLLDLISEGNIGLMKGVDRFDPARGAKLSTYSAWWIKQTLKRALANQSKTIRLPVHVCDKIFKVNRASMKLSEELGREPTDEEIAQELGTSSRRVSDIRTASIRPASLEAPVSDEDSTQLGELVGDENAACPFEATSKTNMRQHLREVLSVLGDRERYIITKRFGLDGGRPLTLEIVGARLKVTRERIRQLQLSALRKLRRALAHREKPLPKPYSNGNGNGNHS